MKRFVRHVVITVFILSVLAGLLVYAGIYNVSARVGHLPPTAWLLHFAMRKSARTHALGIDVPPLEDERMIVRGATYFSVGCAACHGEPGNPHTPVVNEMTPQAPSLAPMIKSWKTRELFWIVDNGIKYTGMPAWATGTRPDEVWSMVAFLLKLPDLDTETYRKLAYEPGPDLEQRPAITNQELDERFGTTLSQCARCHGFDGMGRGTGAFPYLTGQNETYLFETMRHFANGERKSGIMQPIAGGLFETAMRDIAKHYATVTPRSSPAHSPVDAARIERGARIASVGVERRGVPACRHCHGPGNAADNPAFPKLAGQNEDYLVQQLKLLRSGTRGGTAYAPLMTTVAAGLDAGQIREVAAYYASLPYFSPTAAQRN
jgi:cytochrome c553